MSITSYQELQVALANGLKNAAMSARVTELIALFEGEIKTDLRVRQMESRSTASTTGGQAALALPSDFLEMRNLRLNTDPVQILQFLPPNSLDVWHSGQTSGVPVTYKIVGSEIVFGPAPDGVYTVEMDYYSFAVLSSTNAANWLLTANPSVYLYGSLAQAGGLGMADEKALAWTAKYESLLDKIRNADRGARWNGSPLVARPDFVTP